MAKQRLKVNIPDSIWSLAADLHSISMMQPLFEPSGPDPAVNDCWNNIVTGYQSVSQHQAPYYDRC